MSVALAVLPAPDSVVLTIPVVLLLAPPVVALTCTLRAQEPLLPSAPPDKLRLVAAAVGLKVPPQVLLETTGLSTSKPAGNESLMASPLSAVAFGLLKLMVSVDVPPTAMLLGVKLFVTLGGETTVIEAIEVLPVPPLPEETVTLLFLRPAVVAVRLTCT